MKTYIKNIFNKYQDQYLNLTGSSHRKLAVYVFSKCWSFWWCWAAGIWHLWKWYDM